MTHRLVHANDCNEEPTMAASTNPSVGDDFPTQNSLIAMGGFEMQIKRSTDAASRTFRVGWFEDSGSGSSVSWSTGGGPLQVLAQGVHQLDVNGADLMLLGATSEGGKIVVAWDNAR